MVSGIIGGVRDWIDRVGMKLFCIYFTRLREFSEFNCNFASSLAETILCPRVLMVDGWDTYIGKAFVNALVLTS